MLKSSKISYGIRVRKEKSWLRMCGALQRGKCTSDSYFCMPKLSSAASRNLRLAQPSGKFWLAKIQKQWREIQNSNFDSHFWQENGLISKNSLPDLSHKWFSSPFGDFSFFWAILGAKQKNGLLAQPPIPLLTLGKWSPALRGTLWTMTWRWFSEGQALTETSMPVELLFSESFTEFSNSLKICLLRIYCLL